ncbi:hypothetical protein GCM10020229_60460 [Kitasatospora albolonga]
MVVVTGRPSGPVTGAPAGSTAVSTGGAVSGAVQPSAVTRPETAVVSEATQDLVHRGRRSATAKVRVRERDPP